VQQIGEKGSYLITLPKKWCEINNITNGTELEVVGDPIGDATLLISLPKEGRDIKHEIELPFSPLYEDNRLSRAILQRYLDGYGIIRIVGTPIEAKKKLEARGQIKRLKDKLYGCDYSEPKNQFRLEIMSELTSPIKPLEELFDMSSQMLSDSIESYISNNKELAVDIEERDDEADKLYFHIVRTLKTLLREPVTAANALNSEEFSLMDSLDLRMVASYIENLADSAESVAKAVYSRVTDLSIAEPNIEELRGITTQITTNLEKSFRYFRENDYMKATQTIPIVRKLFPRIEKLRDINIHLEVVRTLEEAVECIIDICDLVGE
jgi:phosphate uptake regulator